VEDVCSVLQATELRCATALSVLCGQFELAGISVSLDGPAGAATVVVVILKDDCEDNGGSELHGGDKVQISENKNKNKNRRKC